MGEIALLFGVAGAVYGIVLLRAKILGDSSRVSRAGSSATSSRAPTRNDAMSKDFRGFANVVGIIGFFFVGGGLVWLGLLLLGLAVYGLHISEKGG